MAQSQHRGNISSNKAVIAKINKSPVSQFILTKWHPYSFPTVSKKHCRSHRWALCSCKAVCMLWLSLEWHATGSILNRHKEKCSGLASVFVLKLWGLLEWVDPGVSFIKKKRVVKENTPQLKYTIIKPIWCLLHVLNISMCVTKMLQVLHDFIHLCNC